MVALDERLWRALEVNISLHTRPATICLTCSPQYAVDCVMHVPPLDVHLSSYSSAASTHPSPNARHVRVTSLACHLRTLSLNVLHTQETLTGKTETPALSLAVDDVCVQLAKRFAVAQVKERTFSIAVDAGSISSSYDTTQLNEVCVCARVCVCVFIHACLYVLMYVYVNIDACVMSACVLNYMHNVTCQNFWMKCPCSCCASGSAGSCTAPSTSCSSPATQQQMLTRRKSNSSSSRR